LNQSVAFAVLFVVEEVALEPGRRCDDAWALSCELPMTSIRQGSYSTTIKRLRFESAT
jgi:hypothetical protein